MERLLPFSSALELWAGEMVAGIDFAGSVRSGIGRKVRLTLEQIAVRRKSVDDMVAEIKKEERAVRSELLNMEPVSWRPVDSLGVQRSNLRDRVRGLGSERRAVLERGERDIGILHGVLLHYVNQLLILKKGREVEGGRQGVGEEAEAYYSEGS